MSWTIFAHPLFLDQIELLTQQVETLRQQDATGFVKKNATKRLTAVAKLAFEVIPQDPARAEYRQGNTLGEDHKHWFRAKFFQQYWLFFRYHAQSKVIVFAWVNDEELKCGAGLNPEPVQWLWPHWLALGKNVSPAKL